MYRTRPNFVKSNQPPSKSKDKKDVPTKLGIPSQRLRIPPEQIGATDPPGVTRATSATGTSAPNKCIPNICNVLGLGVLECGFLKLQGPLTLTQLYSIIYSAGVGAPTYLGVGLKEAVSKEISRWYISNILLKVVPQILAFLTIIALLRYNNTINTKTAFFVSIFVVVAYIQSVILSYVNDLRLAYDTMRNISSKVSSNWTNNSAGYGQLITSSYLGNNFCPV